MAVCAGSRGASPGPGHHGAPASRRGHLFPGAWGHALPSLPSAFQNITFLIPGFYRYMDLTQDGSLMLPEPPGGHQNGPASMEPPVGWSLPDMAEGEAASSYLPCPYLPRAALGLARTAPQEQGPEGAGMWAEAVGPALLRASVPPQMSWNGHGPDLPPHASGLGRDRHLPLHLPARPGGRRRACRGPRPAA